MGIIIPDNIHIKTIADITSCTSNRNLLDNPWFTINQRGISGLMTSGSYSVDRWKSWLDNFVTVNLDGTLTLTPSSENGLFQYFEKTPINDG